MTQHLEQDGQTSPTQEKPKKRRRILRFFLIAALLFVGAGAWFYYHETSCPIAVEKATPARALGWLALRDFSEESEETREQLFDYYYSSIGGAKESSKSAEKPKLKLPKSVRNVSSFFLAGSEKKANEWAEHYDRPSYVRVDYLIRRTSKSESPYVSSRDIVPGPALERRWNARRDAVAKGKTKKSKVEKNIQLLVMQWFVSKYRKYDATPDDQKKEFLETTADEMEALQQFYELARASSDDGDKRSLTRAELIAEFERMLEGWYEVAPLKDVAKAVWFKDALITTVVAREMRLDPEALGLYPPKLPQTDGERFDVEALKKRATEAARAAKRFVVRPKAN